MKKTVYTAGAVQNTIRNLTAAGAEARTIYADGIQTVIITKAGYKTYIFTFWGVHTDGSGLYTLRKYNETPKKYA